MKKEQALLIKEKNMDIKKQTLVGWAKILLAEDRIDISKYEQMVKAIGKLSN